MNKIIYPDISYKIIGAAMKVHNQLGHGWDENSYHVAHIARMLSYLRQKEMPFGIIANFGKNNLELRCVTLQ